MINKNLVIHPNNNSNTEKNTDLFMLSVDTELKIDRVAPSKLSDLCILGKLNGKEIGIPLIMQLLEDRGMRGVFFIDMPFVYIIGESKFREIIDLILDRGHDVQVHLHPGGLSYSENKTLIRAARNWRQTGSVESFRITLEHCVGLFEKYVNYSPIAFRNGAYHFKREYMDVLAKLNFKYDSSFNTFRNWHEKTGIWESCRTTPYMMNNGIIEFPVTWASFPLMEHVPGRKQKIVTGINCGYMEDEFGSFRNSFVNRQHRPSMFFMALIHSFTFIQLEILELDGKKKNVFSDKEDHRRIKVLNLLLDKIVEMPSIETVTFLELQKRNYTPPTNNYSMEPFPQYHRDTDKHSYGWLRKYSASYLAKLEKNSNE